MVGFRQMKLENKASIHKFLKKIGQDTTDTYALDTNLLRSLANNPYKPGWPNGFRPVQIRTYNSQGLPVMQWASCEGFLKDLKTFDSVPPKNRNGLDTIFNLREDLNRYSTLEGKPATPRIPAGYDYYVLVYFAKYFPKLTKESFSQLKHYKARHPELKFKVYKINVDYQENWGVDIDSPITFHGKHEK
jgi:hypothetical protein